MNSKQKMVIAIILGVGALLAALILLPVRQQHKNEATQNGPEGANAQQSGASQAAKPPSAQPKMVRLSDEQLKKADLDVAVAGAKTITSALSLPGEIGYNEDRTAHVVPRLQGVVEFVHADLGQKVRKGELLAVIASTALAEQRSQLLSAQRKLSLLKTTYEREKRLWEEKISAEQDYLQARQAMQEGEIELGNAQQKLQALGASGATGGALNRYELRAPFAGTIMEKHLTLGEAVKEDANIFTISDLSTVWAEIAVPATALNQIKVGDKVSVRSTAFNVSAQGQVSYVGALLGDQTRTAKARVVLANPDLSWRPGLFVTVEIVTGQSEAKVAVPVEAVQTVEEKPTVFVAVPDGFIGQPVTLGRSDGSSVEILTGLQSGARYAAKNAFVLKSELGKSGSEHGH